MGFVAYLVLFLAMAGHSSALYCLCKDGLSQPALQKAIDYACGAGADCTPILQNGVCFNPNTVQDHCNYAVNSYFQRKAQAPLSCDFAGAAVTSPSPPSTAVGSCVYPTSAGSGTPTTTPSTVPTGTGTGTGGTGTSTVFGGNPSSLGPTSTTGMNDSSSVALFSLSHFIFSIALILWVSCQVVLVRS